MLILFASLNSPFGFVVKGGEQDSETVISVSFRPETMRISMMTGGVYDMDY